ncbi:MAG: signal peptidase I [Candidatus Zixiibacteriota bacterium]
MAVAARKQRSAVRDYLEAILVAAIVAVVLRTFVVQAYRIPSDSMVNTLLPGDYLLVSKLAYQLGDPKPGDIMVFQYPLNPSKDFVKRCIAVEGQSVEIRDKVVYVNGTPAPVPAELTFLDSRTLPANLSNRDNFGPVNVPPGHIFVLGDNRDDSRDSRDWGFLDRKLIRGKALFVYWSWAPDPDAPKWESPYILPLLTIPFYNLAHFPQRVRWSRIGHGL